MTPPGDAAGRPWDRLMTAHVIVTDEVATRVIRLRRPEKKNAITQEMFRAISDAIDKAQNNPKIRCLIITGGSGVFTAGNDIEDLLAQGTSAGEAPPASDLVKFLYSLAHNVKPIIAAVDGVAMGIGTTMLFHCDYVLASKTALFSTPFSNFGLVPEGASSLLMPRMMGHQRAFAMLVMGRTMSADAPASPASSTPWWRRAMPRSRRTRSRARSVRCRRRRWQPRGA